MKKDKKQKPKSVFYKPVESTQQNIPVKDIVDGIIINKNDRCVKMFEVEPTPFFLKKTEEQNRIGDCFKSILKTAPSELHIKTLAINADLSEQIERAKQDIQNETSEECIQMGREYLHKINYVQNTGVSRRFFISFPYEGKTKPTDIEKFNEIKYSLELDANRMIGQLEKCGNGIVKSKKLDENMTVAKTLYTICNRDKYLNIPFEEKISELYSKYKASQNGEPYIPVADIISPDKISFEESKYLIVNDTYYSFLYIPSYGYYSNVYIGWINRFVNSFLGVDVDIFLKRIPREQVMNNLKRSITLTQVDLSEINENSDAFADTRATNADANYLRDGLRAGEEFYYMATVITVSGDSPSNVEYKVNELKKAAAAMNIVMKDNMFNYEKSFEMTLPGSTWDDKYFNKMKRNILTDGAASLYPFTTFQIMDKNGMYIADDMQSGAPIILDTFNSTRTNNAHIFVVGETGSGKSVCLSLLALRARIQHQKVYILAPEKEDEFRRMTSAIGGQFVSLGSGSRNRINIMEILKEDQSSIEKKEMLDGTSGFNSTSLLSEKIGTLIDFIQLHIPDITMVEKQLLNEAIIKVYADKGITISNKSLWADEEHTKYKKMPILKDLVTELERKKETLRLSKSLSLLTIGAGAHFNGPTNVNLNNDFVVIGLEKNTKEMLPLSIYVAMEYCWSKIKEDRTQKKMLIIDEWWKLAFNPIAADKSLQISKTARSYSCSMVIATQNIKDVFAVENGKYGEAVLNNCATKILLRMQDKDIENVAQIIDLSESEEQMIARFEPKSGSALLIAGQDRVQMRIMPSETEKLLVFTDSDTLNKYIQKKKEKEEAEKRKKIYQEAELLDNIITPVNKRNNKKMDDENPFEISPNKMKGEQPK